MGIVHKIERWRFRQWAVGSRQWAVGSHPQLEGEPKNDRAPENSRGSCFFTFYLLASTVKQSIRCRKERSTPRTLCRKAPLLRPERVSVQRRAL